MLYIQLCFLVDYLHIGHCFRKKKFLRKYQSRKLGDFPQTKLCVMFIKRGRFESRMLFLCSLTPAEK